MLDTKLNAIIWAQLDAIFDAKIDPIIGAQLDAIFDTKLDSGVLDAWFGHLTPALCHPYLRLKKLRL